MKYPVLILLSILITFVEKAISQDYESIRKRNTDSLFFHTARQKYKELEIDPLPDYMGGLTPQIPMAQIFLNCDEPCENDWKNKGRLCGCLAYVALENNEVKIISSRKDLRRMYTPISSSKEALSYAIAASKAFPVFDESFFKKKYTYFLKNLKTTSIIEKENNYYITLFDYDVFGCGEHLYSKVVYLVTKDGEIKEVSRQKAFKNPKDDDMCVD